MRFIIKRYLLTVASLFILSQLISSVKINGSWQGLFTSSLILVILFHIIKPLLNLVMFPINLITLNLTSWLAQIVIFYLWTILGGVSVSPWQFSDIYLGPITISGGNLVNWQTIIVTAIIYILLDKLLNWLFN